MARPLVTYPDPERLIVDLLTAGVDAPSTVGVNLPAAWTPSSPGHIQVVWESTPLLAHPVTISSTIRLVAWSSTKTAAKALALEAHGHVLAYSGGDTTGLVTILPLTGPLPASDPDHMNAELCAVTVRVTVRSTVLT